MLAPPSNSLIITVQRAGQALPAIFLRHRDAHPAAVGVLLVGFLEAGRRGHAAVGVALAAFHVADAVERLHDFLGELGGLFEDRRERVGRRVGEARQVAVALHVKHVVQQELHIVHGRLVGRHVRLLESLLAARTVISASLPASRRARKLRSHSITGTCQFGDDAVDLGLLPFEPLDALVEFLQRDLELRHLPVAEVVEVEHLAHFLEREADRLAGEHIGEPRAVAPRVEALLAAPRRIERGPFPRRSAACAPRRRIPW